MRASLAALLSLLLPAIASAHEVYVLTPAEISSGLATPPWSEAAVVAGDLHHFLFWAFVAALTVFVVFGISIIRPLERWLDPALARLRPYAAPVARVTVGISFLAAAYYQALFGPELPLGTIFGAWAGAVTVLLIVLGMLITFGLYVRAAALAALCLFGVEIAEKGLYMLTYANYLGEILVLLILGTHHGVGPAAKNAAGAASRIAKRLAPYSFALLRVTFGISLFYASFYAKILHNNLALQVAALPLAGHAHSLAYAFGFEPHFLVVGAAIVELVIATFFILGIEIRFTSLFLLFWLSLSLWYFGEVVWPHIILIGIPIAFICAGYDRYSLEGWLLARGRFEPVL